jgi:hypothetical protein
MAIFVIGVCDCIADDGLDVVGSVSIARRTRGALCERREVASREQAVER